MKKQLETGENEISRKRGEGAPVVAVFAILIVFERKKAKMRLSELKNVIFPLKIVKNRLKMTGNGGKRVKRTNALKARQKIEFTKF